MDHFQELIKATEKATGLDKLFTDLTDIHSDAYTKIVHPNGITEYRIKPEYSKYASIAHFAPKEKYVPKSDPKATKQALENIKSFERKEK